MEKGGRFDLENVKKRECLNIKCLFNLWEKCKGVKTFPRLLGGGLKFGVSGKGGGRFS